MRDASVVIFQVLTDFHYVYLAVMSQLSYFKSSLISITWYLAVMSQLSYFKSSLISITWYLAWNQGINEFRINTR